MSVPLEEMAGGSYRGTEAPDRSHFLDYHNRAHKKLQTRCDGEEEKATLATQVALEFGGRSPGMMRHFRIQRAVQGQDCNIYRLDRHFEATWHGLYDDLHSVSHKLAHVRFTRASRIILRF